MDSLDFGIHRSILEDLARCKASTDADITRIASGAALPEPAQLDPSSSPTTSNGGSGFFKRLSGAVAGSAVAAGVRPPRVLTAEQANCNIAYATYALTHPTAAGASAPRLLALLTELPQIEIEGAATHEDIFAAPTAAVLASTVVSALLELASTHNTLRSTITATIASTHGALLDQLSANADAARAAKHTVPTLHGFSMALAGGSFAWTLDEATALAGHATPEPQEMRALGLDAPSKPRVYALTAQRIALTAALLGPDGPGLTKKSIAGTASGGPSWPVLVARGGKNLEQLASAPTELIERALKVHTRSLDALVAQDDEDRDAQDGLPEADPHLITTAVEALKLAVVGALASPGTTVHMDVLSVLMGLAAETAVVAEVSIQNTALEGLVLLLQAHPDLATTLTPHLRRLITSPFELFETRPDQPAPETLRLAARALAVSTRLEERQGGATSIVYSLFNYVPASASAIGRRGSASSSGRPRSDSASVKSNYTTSGTPMRSEAQKIEIAVNAIHAATAYADHLNEKELTSVTLTLLLQRVDSAEVSIASAAMSSLATLAPHVDDNEFDEIVTSLSTASRNAVPTDEDTERASAVLTAQTLLANALVHKPTRAGRYLDELLSLFVQRGVNAITASATPSAHASSQLLALLPVIDALMAVPEFKPQKSPSRRLIGLFRDLWLLVVRLGRAPGSMTEWQRNALGGIAAKTPCLVAGEARDYVGAELSASPILRAGSAARSIGDGQRTELAGLIPQHAASVRSLAPAEVTLLLAIAYCEDLRAEAGRPSVALQYMRAEAIAQTDLLGPVGAIVERSGRIFGRRISGQIERHALERETYAELKAIVIAACTTHTTARQSALRYMDTLVGQFRSLLCDQGLVTVVLEALTLLRRACDTQYEDEYAPIYTFTSKRADFSIDHLPDEYDQREAALRDVYTSARGWLEGALARAPLAMQDIFQTYLGLTAGKPDEGTGETEMGKSVAIELARTTPTTNKEASLPAWGGWRPDSSVTFSNMFGARRQYEGAAKAVSRDELMAELREVYIAASKPAKEHAGPDAARLRSLLYRAGGYLIVTKTADCDMLHLLVRLPVQVFTPASAAIAVEVWTWVADRRPDLEARIMIETTTAWTWTLRARKGLFSSAHDPQPALLRTTEYTPTDKGEMSAEYRAVSKMLEPHAIMLDFAWSRFQGYRYRSPALVAAARHLVLRSCRYHRHWSTHPLTRELRTKLVAFAFCIVQATRAEAVIEYELRKAAYDAALSWFALKPNWSYGGSRLQLEADVRALRELQRFIEDDQPVASHWLSTFGESTGFLGSFSPERAAQHFRDRHTLLRVLLEHEVGRLNVWLNPLNDVHKTRDLPLSASTSVHEGSWPKLVEAAWIVNPALATRLGERFANSSIKSTLKTLVRARGAEARHVADALDYFVGKDLASSHRTQFRQMLFWAAVSPLVALKFFLPEYEGEAHLVQFAMRVLEQHPVELVFFYVPQVVQGLRTDELGYVERFIFETAQLSQLFCHQIIWNMKANCYKDDNAEEEDPMKPTFDRMTDRIVTSLSGDAKDFYDREFTFFDTVTSISKKLQPFIKKSKAEKKAKIDEEIEAIKVDKGVYLPSNADGVVIDIDRKSGRPLQSHAKAPFMATFKIRKEKKRYGEDDDAAVIQGDGAEPETYETWQAAIFKVGDDCRQDVLALQMIAQFKNIFTSLGLDVHLVPYRVTATGPGMGVIDVVPNATSRDEMGRAKINDLFQFFRNKFGEPDTPAFQRARGMFIRSMAAYSLACYIIQIKDRHNGNIMIDGNGCIVHIDFGFLFDTSPGGNIGFEPNSFKLTHEMVDVMGGVNSQGFRQFSELLVKSFLACRPFVDDICATARLMIGTDLPAYRFGLGTIDRLRDRFKPDLSERQAAEYMLSLLANAKFSNKSILYDQFQTLQYKR